VLDATKVAIDFVGFSVGKFLNAVYAQRLNLKDGTIIRGSTNFTLHLGQITLEAISSSP
jgi:hypothetical protein